MHGFRNVIMTTNDEKSKDYFFIGKSKDFFSHPFDFACLCPICRAKDKQIKEDIKKEKK